MYFHYVPIISLGNGHDPSFKSTGITCIQDCFVPDLTEIVPAILKKKIQMWKVYKNNDSRNGQNFNQKSSLWAVGSGELKQEAHGPHCSPEKTVQINKHIWLYHKVD